MMISLPHVGLGFAQPDCRVNGLNVERGSMLGTGMVVSALPAGSTVVKLSLCQSPKYTGPFAFTEGLRLSDTVMSWEKAVAAAIRNLPWQQL